MMQSDIIRNLAEELQRLTANKDYTSVEEIEKFILIYFIDNKLDIVRRKA